MSAVLQQAQNLYKKVIFVEGVILVSISLLLLFYSITQGVSFLLGGIASLLPFCVFVYWVFFKKSQHHNKMRDFYCGEGLKWLFTIVLFVVILKSYANLSVVFFFAGYFCFLLCNSLLPIVLKRWISHRHETVAD